MWSMTTIEKKIQQRRFSLAAKVLISILVSFTLLATIDFAYGKITTAKTPTRSQFTNPPLHQNTAPNASRKDCEPTESTLKEAINCFKNKQFIAAKNIFRRVKKKATVHKNIPLKIETQIYLACIDIEQNKINLATQKINHLYSLRSKFTLQQYGIYNKKYSTIFERVKQYRLSLTDKNTDTLSNKKINTEIECSLKGNCDHEITCIIAGNCDDEIKCSLTGTCNHQD